MAWIIDGCLYENYDTNFCRYLGLQGRDLQDYCIEHFSEIASVEDVEDLSENFGINPPEGFFIENLKKAKQTNLENNNDNGIIFDDEVF